MPDDRPTKTCPDCAETVAAAARKCRFCGYRFEPAPRPASPGAGATVLSLLRRTEGPRRSLHDLLDEWDIPYGDGNPEPALFNGSISGDFGFIVVTQTRFYFVPATRASKAVAVREQHSLGDLLRVHTRRRRMRRALFIEWRSTRTIVELDAAQRQALHDVLSPHALIDSQNP